MDEKGDREDTIIWDAIEETIVKYHDLQLSALLDYQKFYVYSLITHSTALEGSTLTELDTQLLFDEGITAKGKLLIHHLMNEDLKNAYHFASLKAKERFPVSTGLLQELNARVMKSTGSIMNTIGGSFDSSQGEFRLCGVSAGYRGSSYMDYRKVPGKVAELCDTVNKRLGTCETLQDKYQVSFDAHLNLVSIHPWIDGNGRTSRLLMNYLQFYNHIIPSKVYKDDKADYITSLVESREQEESRPFRRFMAQQLLKMLNEEISKHEQGSNKEMSLLF